MNLHSKDEYSVIAATGDITSLCDKNVKDLKMGKEIIHFRHNFRNFDCEVVKLFNFKNQKKQNDGGTPEELFKYETKLGPEIFEYTFTVLKCKQSRYMFIGVVDQLWVEQHTQKDNGNTHGLICNCFFVFFFYNNT